jgi:hypothetical protein
MQGTFDMAEYFATYRICLSLKERDVGSGGDRPVTQHPHVSVIKHTNIKKDKAFYYCLFCCKLRISC